MDQQIPVASLFASPCAERTGVSYPCLLKGFAGPCPMNRAIAGDLADRCKALYSLGYPYGAWVVKEDPLRLFPSCNLQFFREKPSAESLRALYGSRFLHYAPADPAE